MSVSRREFLVAVPAAGAALALLPAFTIRRAPIVSFHLDRPYLDLTGLQKPYLPPAGMRAGAPLADLGDEVLSRFYGAI